MPLRIRASGWGKAAIACGLVAFASVAAGLLRTAFGPDGCAMILLAPVLVVGPLYGVRTAVTAAGLAYLVYAFLFLEPFAPSKLGLAGHTLTLPAFLLAALVAGGFTAVLRTWRRGAATPPDATRAVIEATAFFNVTPNEAAIRQKLAETISAITRTATVVTDREGRLRYRADAGADRIGAIEDELGELARAAVGQRRDPFVTRGDFRARLIGMPGEVQGAVIWRRPACDRARMAALDEHVELLADLAAAAIARSQRDHTVQMGASSN
jgi:K+-sensing histidine kinase KdpD